MLTCFRLTKDRATLFRPETIVAVSSIFWCYFSKCYRIITQNASFWCSIMVPLVRQCMKYVSAFSPCLPSYMSPNLRMALFLTEIYHVERRLDIYYPLLAMLPTGNSLSLSFYFPSLCLTASLVPIHSYTINDGYNVLYLFLKSVS